MKKILPIILALVGLGAGVGAGVMFKPAPEVEAEGGEGGSDMMHAGGDASMKNGHEMPIDGAEGAGMAMIAEIAPEPYDPDVVWEYVKLPRQFVVPVIRKDRVSALVVLTISLETEPGTSDAVLGRQPKLRDGFLQVLFAHANSGGFDGAFTTGESMRDLRGSLKEVAERVVGDIVNSVLIEEIVKQQM